MQKIEHGNQVYWIPECQEGDVNWLLSMLYNVTTRHHAGIGEVGIAWRKHVSERYENIYLNTLDKTETHDRESIARRAANTFLRESYEKYKKMLSGKTINHQKSINKHN